MENADVARVFAEMADLLELTGGNPFKVRAYRQAAQFIEMLPEPLSELWRQGRLTELPSVGARLADHIQEMLVTGHYAEHDQLAERVPPGVLEMLRLEGVGPKTVALAWKELGIQDVAGLEAACHDGRLAALPHLGRRRAEGILHAIQRYEARRGRTPLHHALPQAEALVERLRRVPKVARVEVAGSLRRRRDTVGDIDLLVATLEPGPVSRAFTGAPEVGQVLASGPTKCTVRLHGGLQADLRVVAPVSFGAALHYFTGGKAHNIALRTRAVHRGLKLNEYGVFDRKGRRLGGATEEEVFRAVGLPWIPPELREGEGELEAAEAGTLPDLVTVEDLLGDLHVHSDASTDARSDVDALVHEARRLGRRYLAITDHSRSRPRGLAAGPLALHAAELRRKDKTLRGRPHLLAGVEVDILPDGTLDLPLELLAALDCVVASVHSAFHQGREEMTERICRALRSGVVHVLGHPSGRLLGTRDAYDFDLERVLEAAREHGVALEVNAMPDRLDLTDRACRVAKAAGVPVVISSDSHHVSHLSNLRYGVWTARRGWLEASEVLNTRTLQQLRHAWLHPRGVGRAAAPISYPPTDAHP
ncbi:DNA polymerase/3'-5' exonuclease PolX [Myxococcus sp. RHSTA-1-4]|uniref:DNA polymerase/3'-5' exonuclease PolX n=1 Tax=Myxococcus sp. RHSTA-1-4 TaxID=2874601 RepID=UPI001CBFD66C|nr:DNA polymerase/3'-5' exonuclease PolX [Myxococcus sp. RHSTA-1-4]